MSRWLDRVDELLYDGESVQERIGFGDAAGRGVVVTSHRVLAFTPAADGANYRAVDRPNVDSVERASRGRTGLLRYGVEAGVVGVVLVVAGAFVGLDGLVGGVTVPSTSGQVELGGLIGLLKTTLYLLAMLDDIMLAGGALALVAGTGLAGAYVLTRETSLVVRVAGDADVELPAPSEDGIANRVGRAVDPDATRLESPDDLPAGSPDDAPGESPDGPRAERSDDAPADDPLA